ncbi:MAG: DUF29 family protein [Alphaproteobacteria bacterium]|jgi:hypothetical protein|nr:DUF29 family protein [Alphaproteobacteria bacterium]
MDDVRTLYDTDFYRWATEQAARLRARGEAEAEAGGRSNAPIDWENIAEELEDLGGRHRDAVVSLLAIIIEHALKLEHSTDDEPRRQWTISIRKCQWQVKKRLRASPSLAAKRDDLVADAYENARMSASFGINIPEDDLPPECPYETADLLDTDWLPVNRWGLK